MGDEVVNLYRQTSMLARAVPLAVATPFAAAMLEHVAGGYNMPVYGVAKALAMLGALIFALRWWSFDSEAAKAVRPDISLARGVIMALAVELGGMWLFGLAGNLLARAAHAEAGSIAWFISATVPVLLWAMLSVLLFPWYVGLLTDDTGMSITRSVSAVYPIWGSAFVLYAAAILPPLVLRSLLGMAAGGPLLWPLMTMDAAITATMPLLVAASYYSTYLRARA